MNTIARINRIESKLIEKQESESEVHRAIPIITMPKSLKKTWPKGWPYPILGGLEVK